MCLSFRRNIRPQENTFHNGQYTEDLAVSGFRYILTYDFVSIGSDRRCVGMFNPECSVFSESPD